MEDHTPDEVAQIGAALRALSPGGVSSGARAVDDRNVVSLFPEEMDSVRSAVPARRQQFATGRVLLRELLGLDVPIPVAADRRPVLPTGFVASLAHDDEVAVAVATSGQRFAGLGVDLERIDRFPPEVADAVLRPDDGIADPALAFVAKEAVYKAWSRPGRPILDHGDVRLAAGEDGEIVAMVLPFDDRVSVRATLVAGRWLAVAVQPAPG